MPAHSSKPTSPSPAEDGSAAAAAASAEAASESAADAAQAPAEDVEDVPMNRAERRAKGKGSAKPQVVGKIQPVRTNNGNGPRSYANRRSG
jgi:hypothetical protein